MSDLEAAVAAGVLGADEDHRALLQATVEVARAIFGAKAASVFLLDEEADELVFAAVASEEEQFLVGQRFPSSTGIAGWVASSQTPLVLEDVQTDPRFARDIAERSGYVPKGIMAVPLLDEERVLGVLQVLDRPSEARFSLREMELLGLFASQAAIALSLLMTARSARAALAGDAQGSLVADLAGALDRLEGASRDSADALLRSLVDLFGGRH